MIFMAQVFDAKDTRDDVVEEGEKGLDIEPARNPPFELYKDR
jgi:hypothetical protein